MQILPLNYPVDPTFKHGWQNESFRCCPYTPIPSSLGHPERSSQCPSPALGICISVSQSKCLKRTTAAAMHSKANFLDIIIALILYMQNTQLYVNLNLPSQTVILFEHPLKVLDTQMGLTTSLSTLMWAMSAVNRHKSTLESATGPEKPKREKAKAESWSTTNFKPRWMVLSARSRRKEKISEINLWRPSRNCACWGLWRK